MTVTFRQLRYGDQIDALELNKKIQAGNSDVLDSDNFILSLVLDWDFQDIETGEPIPVSEPRLLSIDQVETLRNEFNIQMQDRTGVKKTNAARSSYGRNASRPAKQAATSPKGLRNG